MSRLNRPLRWLMLIAGGCMLFQTQCNFELIQTGLLAGIAGGMYYLVQNI